MGIVLVAEDDRSTLYVICHLIEKLGHTAIRVRNGQTAWDIIEENPILIDLLITDLMMPKLDGHALIKKVRSNEETAHLPIIVQSAYLGVKKTRLLMEEGIDAVIPKPLDSQYLMDHVTQYMSRPNLTATSSV